ncbi:hypothetical protein J2X34_000916 [Rhodococcus sp. BE178]
MDVALTDSWVFFVPFLWECQISGGSGSGASV